MNYEQARELLNDIEKTKLNILKNNLIEAAIGYSRMRVDYLLANQQQRINMEQIRTIKHNVFIDSCNILSRNMLKNNENADWRKIIGNDRKELGDFACFINCILGIRAR